MTFDMTVELFDELRRKPFINNEGVKDVRSSGGDLLIGSYINHNLTDKIKPREEQRYYGMCWDIRNYRLG